MDNFNFLKTHIVPHVGEYTAAYMKDGKLAYSGPKSGPPSDDLIRQHLTGKTEYALGVRPVKDGTTGFTVFDIDCKDGDTSDRDDRAAKVKEALEKLGIPYHEMTSGSGNGLHLWVLYNQPVKKEWAVGLAKRVAKISGVGIKSGKLEIYPDGANIALPFGRKSEPLFDQVRLFDPATTKFRILADEEKLLRTLGQVDNNTVRHYGRAFKMPDELEALKAVADKASHMWLTGDKSKIIAVRFVPARRKDAAVKAAKDDFGDGEIYPRDGDAPGPFGGWSLPVAFHHGKLTFCEFETSPLKKRKPGPKSATNDKDAAFECAASTYDINDRDKGWIAFAMALKEAFPDDDWAKEKWLEWSATYHKPDRAYDEAWWDSEKNAPTKSNPYAFWSSARDGGYKGKTPYSKKDEEKLDVLRLILDGGTVFRGTHGFVYVDLGNRRNYKIDSEAFQSYVIAKVYRDTGKAVSRDTVATLIGVVKASVESSAITEVHTRFARHDGKAYLFLGDDNWTVLEIDADGYRVCENPPVKFMKTSTMATLPMPDDNGTLTDFEPFYNFGTNEDARLFLFAWMVKCVLRPDSVTPGLLFQGERGSGKTTAMRNTAMLVDPQIGAVSAPPKDEADLVIAATNAAVVTFDNITNVTPIAESMTRLITGNAIKTRKLYTNDELFILEARRPILFTGIEPNMNKSDLIERFVYIDLQRVQHFTNEERLNKEYLIARPRLLHALLTLCVQCERTLRTTYEPNEVRNPGFAHVGEAVASIISKDYQEGDFVTIYNEQLETEQASAAEGDAVFRLMKMEFFSLKAQNVQRHEFDLVELLDRWTSMKHDMRMTGELPRTTNGLAQRISGLRSKLSDLDYSLTSERVGGKRKWVATANFKPDGENAFDEMDLSEYAETYIGDQVYTGVVDPVKIAQDARTRDLAAMVKKFGGGGP